MSDDIVRRLRNHVRGDYEKTAEFMLGLAADEIERLQALVEHLSSQLRLQMKANDRVWEAYEEATANK